MINAVGYRVNSYKATRFRQWATSVHSEYIRNGAVLDDERFKQGGKQVQAKFDQLLERIQEIRASERMAYQKMAPHRQLCHFSLHPSPFPSEYR